MSTPNPPKKSLTPYFRFRGDVYVDVKANNSTLAPKDIMSKIGAMWRELTQKKKDQYKADYLKGKEEYLVKLEAYEEKYGKVEKKKPKRKRKAKNSDYSSEVSSSSEDDPNRPDPPKRPLSTFFRYVRDTEQSFKEEFPGVKRTQLVSKISEAWGKKTEKFKSKYTKQWTAEKEVFTQKYEAYVAKWGKPKRRKRKNKSTRKSKSKR